MQARHQTQKKTAPIRRPRKADVYKVKVLFIEGTGGWSAQVLEYDIATQAKSLQDLFYEVERILVAYVALATEDGRQPFEGIPRAPEKYWEVFENSQITMQRPLAGIKARKLKGLEFQKDIRVAERTAA